jgi:hypothetical protein
MPPPSTKNPTVFKDPSLYRRIGRDRALETLRRVAGSLAERARDFSELQDEVAAAACRDDARDLGEVVETLGQPPRKTPVTPAMFATVADAIYSANAHAAAPAYSTITDTAKQFVERQARAAFVSVARCLRRT